MIRTEATPSSRWLASTNTTSLERSPRRKPHPDGAPHVTCPPLPPPLGFERAPAYYPRPSGETILSDRSPRGRAAARPRRRASPFGFVNESLQVRAGVRSAVGV